MNDDRRMYQCFLYARDPGNPSDRDSNHYAFPLAISPVIDTVESKVIRVDLMPTGADATTTPTQAFKMHPPNEYLSGYQDLRTDLKPLHVIQPDGVSFRVTQTGETGHVIEWQKWSCRVGFNQREGMVLYDVSHDARGVDDGTDRGLTAAGSVSREKPLLSSVAVGHDHPLRRPAAALSPESGV